MCKILHIETATDICSVALSDKEKILSWKSVNEKSVHSSKLTLFIDEILETAGIQMKELRAVSVSKGPGSFTGLRIGVSVAKGICFGLNLPLIAVNTLESLVYRLFSEQEVVNELICPIIDARNNEAYYAIFDINLNEVMETSAGKINSEQFFPFIRKNKMIIIGEEVKKWAEELQGYPEVRMLDSILPDARNLIIPAFKKFISRDFESVEDFEPFYLRDFKARKLSVKIQNILNS